ncbi:hypothetical protein [Nocardioides ultimimeridianus]
MGVAPTADWCAAELRELANDPRFADRRDDLEALAADVADPDGDTWAGVDLFQAFPAADTPRITHKNLAEIVLGMVAGVAVFLPVGWTWWSFKDASSAYRALIAEKGDPEGTTFLSLWTTGFEGHLSSMHRLVPTAMVSVLLVLLAVLSLVAHRGAAGLNVRKEEDARHKARTRLLAAMTRTSLVLHTRRADHPQRIEGIIKSSLESLSQAHESAKGVLKKVEKSSAEVGRGLAVLVETLRATTDEAQALVNSTTAAAEATTAATAQTRATLEAGTASVEAAVAAGAAGIEAVVAQGAEELKRASASTSALLGETIDTAIGRFEQRTVGAVAEAADNLVNTVGHISSSAADSSAAARDFSARVAEFAGAQEDAQRDILGVITQVENALSRIDQTLGRHEGALQGQVTELSAARDAAERMLVRLSAAAQPAIGR